MATSLQNKESSLSVNIYPADKTDRSKFVECMQEWYSTQTYGFTYLDNTCGFWLNNKTVHADSRDEIIQYFVSILPSISKEIEEVLRG